MTFDVIDHTVNLWDALPQNLPRVEDAGRVMFTERQAVKHIHELSGNEEGDAQDHPVWKFFWGIAYHLWCPTFTLS